MFTKLQKGIGCSLIIDNTIIFFVISHRKEDIDGVVTKMKNLVSNSLFRTYTLLLFLVRKPATGIPLGTRHKATDCLVSLYASSRTGHDGF